jgi:hypothetical protein
VLAWLTEDEIDYLKRIGTFSRYSDKGAEYTITLLKQYIEAAKLRYNWSGIGRERVMAFARERLKTLEMKKAGG